MQTANRLYSRLVHPLLVKDGPAGLYPAPRIWGGGKEEWPEYQGHFSYGFLTKAGEVCHPVEGMVVHPYDEVLVCGGTNFDDIQDLGGEMSIEIGEEREERIFDRSQLICIPKGTPHGALKVRKIGSRPICHFMWGLQQEYAAESIPPSQLPASPASGDKYAHLVKLLRAYISPEKTLEMMSKGMRPEDHKRLEDLFSATAKAQESGDWSNIGTGMGYEATLDERGIMHANGIMGPGNCDQLVWLFGEDMQDFSFNFAWGFAGKPGVWHTIADGHYHPEPEILIFVGFNPDDLYDLGGGGARVEVHLGPEFEGHIFKKPTAIEIPAGFVHIPQVTHYSISPYGFQVACLDGYHEAPWVNIEDFE